MLHHPCLLGGHKRRGTKLPVATSPAPSRGPKRGRNCYVTPAFSGVPPKGKLIQIRLPHPYLGGGPKEGGIAPSPLRSWGSPKNREQNQRRLPQPCLLGEPRARGNATQPPHTLGSPTKGMKSEVATSPLSSRGPNSGRNATSPVLTGGPQTKANQVTRGYLTRTFLRAPKRAELLRNPCVLGGSPKRENESD